MSTQVLDEIEKGIQLRIKGSWRKAVSLFKSILIEHPNNADALAHLGQTFSLQRNYSKAEETFKRALDIKPTHSFALIFLGKTYLTQGKYKLAETCLALITNQTLTNYESGMFKDAQEKLSQAKEKITNFNVDYNLPPKEMGVALYNKANQLVIEGDLETALEAYDLAASCRIDYREVDLKLGETIATHEERMPQGEYNSCSWLESGLHFHDERLTFCCTAHSVNKGWTKIGQFNGGKLPIDMVLARRALIAQQLQTGEDNNCKGCPSISKEQWPKQNHYFAHLIFNNFSICNFRCSYCSLTHQNFEMPDYYFDAEIAVNDILDNNWLDPKGTTTWGGGDPSVSKEFKNLLKRLVDRGSFNIVNTNAALHIQEIEDALRAGKMSIMVSIDAGSSEIFDEVKFAAEHQKDKKPLIKGLKAIDAVWNTLEKYIQASPEAVVIKYIVDHNNHSNQEIELFIERCIQHGVKTILITPEAEFIRQIPVTKAMLPPHIFEAMRYATELATKAGMKCMFDNSVYRKDVFLVDKEQAPAELIIAKAC